MKTIHVILLCSSEGLKKVIEMEVHRTVRTLQLEIEQVFRIPVAQQILLMEGKPLQGSTIEEAGCVENSIVMIYDRKVPYITLEGVQLQGAVQDMAPFASRLELIQDTIYVSKGKLKVIMMTLGGAFSHAQYGWRSMEDTQTKFLAVMLETLAGSQHQVGVLHKGISQLDQIDVSASFIVGLLPGLTPPISLGDLLEKDQYEDRLEKVVNQIQSLQEKVPRLQDGLKQCRQAFHAMRSAVALAEKGLEGIEAEERDCNDIYVKAMSQLDSIQQSPEIMEAFSFKLDVIYQGLREKIASFHHHLRTFWNSLEIHQNWVEKLQNWCSIWSTSLVYHQQALSALQPLEDPHQLMVTCEREFQRRKVFAIQTSEYLDQVAETLRNATAWENADRRKACLQMRDFQPLQPLLSAFLPDMSQAVKVIHADSFLPAVDIPIQPRDVGPLLSDIYPYPLTAQDENVQQKVEVAKESIPSPAITRQVIHLTKPITRSPSPPPEDLLGHVKVKDLTLGDIVLFMKKMDHFEAATTSATRYILHPSCLVDKEGQKVHQIIGKVIYMEALEAESDDLRASLSIASSRPTILLTCVLLETLQE